MDVMLEKLLNAFGVSGHEGEVREVILEELKGIDCNVKEDKMGNLIVKLGSGTEKIMFCAHMDEIGLIATYIEDNGFVRVGSIGDFKPGNMVNNFTMFKNGTMGKIAATKAEPEIGDIFIDLGIKGREEVLKVVKEADTACFIGEALEVGKNIISPGLDNRIGCYILLRMIKEIKDTNKEVYFVFSTQQELGGRGARAAAFAIEPDYCVVIDIEQAGDVIGGEGNIALGAGPVVSIMDRTLIMHHEIKEMLDKAAGSDIKLQYTYSTSITDGGTIHKEAGGIKTGVVSVPCRYKHTVSEMVCLEDVEAVIKLLKNLV